MIVGFVCGGLLPGVLGSIKADTEPETARKLTKWAWISFAILWGLAILAIVAHVIFIVVIIGAGAAVSS